MSRCLPEAPTLNRTTPLSYAVRLGRPEVVAALLAHSVAEVNAPDAWLVRPLEYASYMLSRYAGFLIELNLGLNLKICAAMLLRVADRARRSRGRRAPARPTH